MPRTRVLLLMGGADYHNRTFHYAELAGILAGEAGADVRITDDLDVLTPATLAGYDVVANWSTFVKPSPKQGVTGFCRYFRPGELARSRRTLRRNRPFTETSHTRVKNVVDWSPADRYHKACRRTVVVVALAHP